MNASRETLQPQLERPAGYAWVIEQYGLELPRPPQLAGISGRHRPRRTRDALLFPESYAPAASLSAQLTFALKWEGINLVVLEALFRAVSEAEIAAVVRSAPTGAYMRRIWFLHEWLTGRALDLPDLGKVRAVPVVDPKLQLGLEGGELSTRHRVRNNLPGTPAFCPMVRRTSAISAWQAAALGEQARSVIGRTRADVMARAAAFLLLSDSRASYRIEGEKPGRDRLLRWGQAIARAGMISPSVDELEVLQREVIGDDRFVRLGLRQEGGFVGEHDRLTHEPLPEHISARPGDLPSLVEGIRRFDERAGRGAMDPVAAAAAIAFGFVYVHPFEDGNGRIHRWLVHHVLAAAGFATANVIFPVSAVMLREIAAYKAVLESYSRPLLPHIDWEPTPDGNVRVLNDTAPWYRYFDATAHAEFLYHCVESTVRVDLPYEVAFLSAYDRFVGGIADFVDMPARTISLLYKFLVQGAGTLSRRAKATEFARLTDAEIVRVEALFAEATADLPPAPTTDLTER